VGRYSSKSNSSTRVAFAMGYDVSGVEAMGKILRKPIPELLALEAGLALAGNDDLCS
jgi:hypothetical protein